MAYGPPSHRLTFHLPLALILYALFLVSLAGTRILPPTFSVPHTLRGEPNSTALPHASPTRRRWPPLLDHPPPHLPRCIVHIFHACNCPPRTLALAVRCPCQPHAQSRNADPLTRTPPVETPQALRRLPPTNIPVAHFSDTSTHMTIFLLPTAPATPTHSTSSQTPPLPSPNVTPCFGNVLIFHKHPLAYHPHDPTPYLRPPPCPPDPPTLAPQYPPLPKTRRFLTILCHLVRQMSNGPSLALTNGHGRSFCTALASPHGLNPSSLMFNPMQVFALFAGGFCYPRMSSHTLPHGNVGTPQPISTSYNPMALGLQEIRGLHTHRATPPCLAR